MLSILALLPRRVLGVANRYKGVVESGVVHSGVLTRTDKLGYTFYQIYVYSVVRTLQYA